MKTNILACKIYDAYCESVGGKAFNGDELPKSGEFFTDPSKEKQANAWIVATQPVYDLLFSVTQNLGHPAYGQSTSATMAIDELREKSFDFLEVPKE